MKKIGVDLCFNYISLGLLACSGFLINLIIIKTYGPTELGRFNLVYAVYMLASQFSVLGIHYSVLRSLAVDNNQNSDESTKIACSAFFLTVIVSIIFGILIGCLLFPVSYFYPSTMLMTAAKSTLIALPFFSINKVLLSILNGKSYMRLFAIGQAFRYALMLFYILLIGYLKPESNNLFYVFTFAEFILAIILFHITWFYVLNQKFIVCKKWMEKHLRFGAKAFLTGFFLAANARITLIILSFFVSSTMVGVYSFAAGIADGLEMMLTVIRNNVNPILSNLLAHKRFVELNEFMSKVRRYTYIGMTAVILCVFIAYFFLVYFVMNVPELQSSWSILLILSFFIAIASGYLPFLDYLTQAGNPEYQSLQNFLVALLNISLNIIFVPLLGLYGAALSSGLSSYIFSILLINFFARKDDASFIKLVHSSMIVSFWDRKKRIL